jgi:hypothetical protein
VDADLIARHQFPPVVVQHSVWLTSYGRRSFIADMGRPGRCVLRFTDGEGQVIMGESYSRRPEAASW